MGGFLWYIMVSRMLVEEHVIWGMLGDTWYLAMTLGVHQSFKTACMGGSASHLDPK